MSRLALALEQIVGVRTYSLNLLDNIDPAGWYRQPAEGVSHVAWQAGHLAVAEYWLALNRLRGRQPEDAELLSDEFLQRYGRLSTPDPDPEKNSSPTELRAVLDRVHAQVRQEVPGLTETVLDEPVLKPHPLFTTKGQALFWCAQHEMLHAGQIGLLRRLFGKPPLW